MDPLPECFISFTSHLTKQIAQGKELFALKSFVETFDFSSIPFDSIAQYDPMLYKRTLLFRDSHVDVFLIGWNGAQGSKIHDHPDNGCIMRVLNNELSEETYILKENGLEKLKYHRLIEGEVAHIKKNTILHRIFNESKEKSLSLHIYSPPNYKTKYYEDEEVLVSEN